MADQYDAVIQRLVAERANASLTMNKPAPDAVGRANSVALQTGVPPETADRNLAQLEQEVQAARSRQALGNDPVLAVWAGNPRHAGVAADEMEHLARNREYWSRLSGDAKISATPAPAPTIGNFLSGLATNVAEGAREAVGGILQLGADWLPDMTPRSADNVPTLGNYEQENLARSYNRSEARMAAAEPSFKSWFARSLYGGASSAAQMVGAFGIGALTGNPEAGLAFGGLQQGLPAYSKYRSRGASRGMALVGATGEGAVEVATEKIPMDFLVTRLGKIGAGKFLSGFLGRELPSELAATVSQNAIDTAIANPDKTWGEYLREQPDQLAQTAIGTLMTVGLFGGVHHGINRFAEQDADRAKAVDDADALSKAMASAAESKTRARDPEAFAKLIALRTDGTPAENIFVPAEKVASYFQSDGMDYHRDEFWSDYAGQIDEGLATGGDVVIPTARAAAHLAGTPAWAAIEPEVRLSPGGMSIGEAKALEQSHADAMEQLGAQMADEIEAARRAEEPRQRIYQDIRDKLTSAGYTQDAAHLNAELVAQRYATRAQRLGQKLTGNETTGIEVNSVLPPNLAPLIATDQNRVALKSIINVMRGKVPQAKRTSLLDWIAQQGGIEDKGGDLRAMGAADIKGVARKGERKIIRPHVAEGQGEMLGPRPQQNANTPDELALRAQEAGFFPAGERPTVNDLFAKIEQELRGSPVYAENLPEEVRRTRDAADELERILDQQGLDPATATEGEIAKAIDSYRQAQEGGYQQTFGDGPRGQISFHEGRSVIDLFEGRNLSTFIHEMGHQWLEELRQDAEADGANDQIKADWQAVQDWFKTNGHPVADGVIPADAHELWARGVERFAMEGKAPSSALRRVFDAFKAWMLNIYQVVDNLRAPITPEIRDVMQRLLATDEEIAAAHEKEALSALFTDAAQAGMTEAQFAEYQKAASDARDEAHDALLYRTMASVRAERTKAWKEEERGVRGEVTERVNRRPEFKALHLLRTGRMLDDPEAPVQKIRIDKGALVEVYGEGILEALPKSVPPIYAEHGAHPDDVAELVGFDSGDTMIRTLIALQDRTKELRDAGDKRSVRQALIDDETDTEMKDRHGDILSDGSIEQEALALVHNEKQGEVIAAELRSLSRRANKKPTPYALAKEWARDKIAQSTVVEATSGSAIQRYTRAAAKAGKAAEAAMLKGDIEETYRQKQAQMLNNALIAEAHRVRDQVEKARDRLASYGRRRTIKSMDQDYLDQIHSLLEQVEFRTRSQSAIERQTSFEEWARAREAEGHDVIVPASFAASLGATHWSRLSVEKLLGLDDTVKQIAHLGRLKRELLDGKEQREFQAVVDEALGSIDKLPPRPPSDLMDPTWGDRIKGRIASVDASLLKMETIVDWLDGGNSDGVFNRVVFKPIADAQAREQDMTADYFGRIRRAMEAVPGEIIKKWHDRVTIPELINRETGNPFVMTRQRLVAMALNVGNEGNMQRLADGYGWSRDQIMAVLNRELSPPEWQFVQSVWDTIDTLWPQIAEMERRINGVEPEKVEATSVETNAGTLRGGYYPAVYDTTRDIDAERNAGSSADLLETTYTKATTRASSTKDRANKVRRPILLDLGVINRHLGEVIHDITHREAIINADKFLQHRQIAKAVNDTLGPEIRKQFRPWLKFVANQWAMERSGNEGLGKFLNKARSNATAVGMGFRVSTIITQLAGYSNSFEAVGAKWVAPAIAQVSAHPIESFRTVMEKSGEVRHRMDTLDRDINAGIKSLAGRRDVFADAKRFAYHGIGYTDRMVVLPTWIGAYNKALAAGKSEEQAIYEGDKAVRQSQGAGAAKDLAAVQRGTGKWGELLKIATMFYSYMSALYQRQRTLGRDTATAVREGNKAMTPQLLARAWWLLVVPPVLSQLLAGRGPDQDEDWGTWSFKQMLFNLLGPIPFARDLIQPVWDGIAGNKSFGAQISPMQRVYDTIDLTAKDIGRKVRGDDTKHMTKDVLETTGYATGVVPGQIASAAQFLVDVGNGSQDPQTASDWYRGLTTGHAQKR